MKTGKQLKVYKLNKFHVCCLITRESSTNLLHFSLFCKGVYTKWEMGIPQSDISAQFHHKFVFYVYAETKKKIYTRQIFNIPIEMKH